MNPCYLISLSANIYLFKVNNRNTRKICEICLKLTIKTPERRSGVFIVIDVIMVFLLLTYFKPFSSVSTVDVKQVNVN